MTEAEIQEIEARREKALDGLADEGGGPSEAAWPSVDEDIPALVAEVRRLQAGLERLRVSTGYQGQWNCAGCGRDMSHGAPDCWLTELIGRR